MFEVLQVRSSWSSLSRQLVARRERRMPNTIACRRAPARLPVGRNARHDIRVGSKADPPQWREHLAFPLRPSRAAVASSSGQGAAQRVHLEFTRAVWGFP